MLDFISILSELYYSYHIVLIVQFQLLYIQCTIALKQFEVLYSWKFFPYRARSHWLLRGHMTFNNKNCFPPKSVSGQHCKIYDARGSQCSVTCKCWPASTVTARFNEFPASSLKTGLSGTVGFVSLGTSYKRDTVSWCTLDTTKWEAYPEYSKQTL